MEADRLKPYLSLLLYLCSDEPEIDDSREPGVSPEYTRPKKVKGGYRLFEPSKVRTWEVGRSISRTLSAAIRATGSHKSPHIRRAHWHGYWTGPRTGDRNFIYRWIPPTAVAIDQRESEEPS